MGICQADCQGPKDLLRVWAQKPPPPLNLLTNMSKLVWGSYHALWASSFCGKGCFRPSGCISNILLRSLALGNGSVEKWKVKRPSDWVCVDVLRGGPPSSFLCNCTFSYEISPVNISWVSCVSYFHLEWVKSQKLAVLGLDFYEAGGSSNLNSALLTLSVMPFGRSGHVTQAVYQWQYLPQKSENCSTIRTFLENQKKINKIKINLENPKKNWKSQNFLKIQKNPRIKKILKKPKISQKSKYVLKIWKILENHFF